MKKKKKKGSRRREAKRRGRKVKRTWRRKDGSGKRRIEVYKDVAGSNEKLE